MASTGKIQTHKYINLQITLIYWLNIPMQNGKEEIQIQANIKKVQNRRSTFITNRGKIDSLISYI